MTKCVFLQKESRAVQYGVARCCGSIPVYCECGTFWWSNSAGVPVTSIIEMAISYNYEYVAMLTGTGLLWIGSADLQVQQANVDDEEIARAINSKLGETPGISYSEIASKAVDCGRTHLAIKLLDYEAEAADQVPLLMRMNKDDLAPEKAIMSGDTDLIFMVVMHLKDNLIPGEFLMVIRYRPVALSLHIKYCKDQDRRTLVDLFYQDDHFINSGNAFVRDSYSEKQFFEVCLECNNRIEAEKYVSRVLLEKKVTCYVKLGKYEDAAETAFAQKSEEGLDLVLGKCATSNRPLVNRI
ncbi:Vacuolar protein sorting-associated protein 16 [Porites harrisoni]